MSRPNPAIFLVFLLTVVALSGGAGLLRGGIYLTHGTVEALELTDIISRMTEGEWPHRDFASALGPFAFLPILALANLGLSVGQAFLGAQFILGLFAASAVWWIGLTRLDGRLAYGLGATVLALVLAISHIGAEPEVTLAGYAARWRWALSAIIFAIAVLPSRDRTSERTDGLILGLSLAFLGLLSPMHLIWVGLPVIVALILRGIIRGAVVALVSGLGVLAFITLLAGFSVWPAYLADAALQRASGGGLGFRALFAVPAVAVPVWLCATGIWFLFQAGREVAAAVLLALLPGIIVATLAVPEEAPVWGLIVAVLILAQRPKADIRNTFGWNLRVAISVSSAALIALGALPFWTMAQSPFRHLAIPSAAYAPLLPVDVRNSRLFVPVHEATHIAVHGYLGESPVGTRVFEGRNMPDCTISSGIPAWYRAVASDLNAAGLVADESYLAADDLSVLWLFSDVARLPGQAPRFAGAIGGFDAADYILIPVCAISPDARNRAVDLIEARDATLTEVRRTSFFTLYAIGDG